MFKYIARLFSRKPNVPAQSGTVNDNPTPQIVLTHKLTPEQYEQLERKLSRLSVGPETTELQAGFQLGVSAVLQHLRNGYTTGG